MRRLLPIVIGVVAVVACSSTPTGTIDVTTGGEADALTRAPAPATIVVEELMTDGTTHELSRSGLPAGDLSLGDVQSSDAGAIRVKAIDGAGKVLVSGETLFFQFGALESSSLEVFLQRTGELARVPRTPAAVLDQPALDVVVGRYLVGASGTSTFLYDLLFLEPLSTSPVLTRPAKSFATFGSVLVSIDDLGASTIDLSDSSTSELPVPTGGNYAEVSGGATISALDGSSYIVGATRSGTPTARVLRISATGTLSFASLTAARAGACATWVEGRGLVVVGGDAAAPGVEILTAGAAAAAPLAYPPDPVKGCAAATLDTTHVVVAAGIGASTDAARVVDLACSAACQPAAWPGSVPLVRAQAVGLAPDATLVGGDDATGAFRVFRASATEAHEIPLKVPRRGARLTVLPITSVAIVGGVADIETYRE